MRNAYRALTVAAALATAAATPAFAQTIARTAGGDDPAPGAVGAYVGATKAAFYSVEQRLAAVEARVTAGAGGRAARAQLNALKAFEARQRARHGGELRDWDREAMTARLNSIEAMVGAG